MLPTSTVARGRTPGFTLSLDALPQHLYSHGSSMLATLQQVAAAFGTALVVTVMSARSTSLISHGTDLQFEAVAVRGVVCVIPLRGRAIGDRSRIFAEQRIESHTAPASSRLT